MLSPNVIILWLGTNASIPSGFTRVTDLDSKFVKVTANSVDPNVTGGNATHTHTSPVHVHTLVNHTHTYSLSQIGTSSQNANASDQNTAVLVSDHAHTGTSGAISGGTTDGTAVTYGAMSNDPPYYEVIYIKPSGYVPIPDDAALFTNQVAEPTGFYHCDGNNGTPDLRNKYLKGASAGANAGGTGGSTSNSHSITHTHGVNTHVHVAANSGGQTIGTGRNENPSASPAAIHTNHVHSVTLNAGTQAINQNTDTLSPSETVEPAYKKLMAIRNTSGGNKLPSKNMIAMWLGTLATIPAGWILCDGTNSTPDMRGKFLKIANATGEIGDTGGSNTHTHAAQSHAHTSNGSHTHSAPNQAHSAVAKRDGTGADTSNLNASHTVENIQSVSATYSSTNTTANSSDNQPEFRTVAFIQYQFSVYGALFFSNLIR